MKSKILFSAVLAGVFMVGSVSVSAVPLTDYYYEAFGGFDSASASGFPSPQFFGYQDPREPDSNIFSNLRWGVPVLPFETGSEAVINEIPNQTPPPEWTEPPSEGQVLSGSGIVDGSRQDLGNLNHHNHTITSAFSNATVDVHYNLWLWDDFPVDPLDPLKTIAQKHFVFSLSFAETPNSAPCAPPNPQGSVCDDIFTYSLVDALSDDPTFEYDGNTYAVEISGFYDAPAPGGSLTESFYSEEGGHNTGYVQFEIQAIPEPESLALMGIGLGGLGFARRRRRKAEKA